MTKRFEYTDIDGIIKEAEAFVASEFVTTSAPNSPVMTTSSGTIHPSLIPPVAQAKASTLVVTRVATGSILRGDLVRATSFNHVGVADPTTNLASANVLGMAQNDASDGQDVEVLILGILSDPIFSVFSTNTILFLDDLGGLTDVKPTKPSKNFLVIVGKALGGNEVFVNISTPVALGV